MGYIDPSILKIFDPNAATGEIIPDVPAFLACPNACRQVLSLLALLVLSLLALHVSVPDMPQRVPAGTQFTCFTGTKVQMLTQLWAAVPHVQHRRVTLRAGRGAADTPRASSRRKHCRRRLQNRLRLRRYRRAPHAGTRVLLALLVQEYKYSCRIIQAGVLWSAPRLWGRAATACILPNLH